MVTLQQGDDDYEYVSRTVLSTLNSKTKVSIKRIQRVENRSLYRKYSQAKKDLQKARAREIEAKKAVLQLELFHGTKKETVQHIIDCGFNRSFAGSVAGTSR